MEMKAVLGIAYSNKKPEIRSLGESRSIVYVTIVTWAGRL